MRLEGFRVQNFKKVRDTGWVSCRDLLVFVGKNEAGKSAVFRGLSKLNPSDGEKCDGLKEFPRRRYTDEFKQQDWPVASGRFSLSDTEQAELAAICPALKGATEVICTRRYSWTLDVEFGDQAPKTVLRREFGEELTRILHEVRDLVAPDGKGDALGQMKTAIHGALEPVRKAQEKNPGQSVPRAEAEQALNAVSGQANEEWQQQLLGSAIEALSRLLQRTAMHEKLAQAVQWVESHLPKFIYFDRYDVIDSAVHLPTFVQKLGNAQTAGPRVRTTRCLFEHVGLEVQRLAALGQHQPGQGENKDIRRYIDERAIHFSSASNAMTQKFTDWWEQRKHKFRYQADGEYFRVWVSDDLDPSDIELDQRSQGMQYFFSFFIVFLVEAQDAHRNSILLLDEPGLHMHGTAQAKIVEFLEKLSNDNQTFYSTHSPFMVDVDHLERARAVFEDKDGTTRVSEDVWPRDKDSLFPLQAALGYQLAQTLFISKRQLIVEGLTDLWLLKALDQALAARGGTTLRDDIVIVPSAGVSKLLPLASMLMGHAVEVGALLDGDEPGRREGKKLVEKLLGGDDTRCLFVGDFVPTIQHAELEDLFPETDYLNAVREAYPSVDLTFEANERALSGIVTRIQALFARKSAGTFEKWRPAAVLRDRICAAPAKAPQQACDAVARIFGAVNAAFSREGT
jgi:hypothetical protein